VANASALFFLAQLVDMFWDCRVFHQLVEISLACLCTLLVTLMRKLIGRLKSRGSPNTGMTNVVTPTVAQKSLLGTATIAFTVDMVVSGAHGGMIMRVIKAVCWSGILGNALYHFTWYQLDLGAAFADVAAPAIAPPSPSTTDIPSVPREVLAGAADPATPSSTGVPSRKVLRAKKKLKTSMEMNIIFVSLFCATYAWWPEGTEGFGVSVRPYTGLVMMVRSVIATVAGSLAGVSLLHSAWAFKKNIRRKNRSGQGRGKSQRWYVEYLAI
jgi:hypothetical protein